jgi:hypothetical protein
MIYITHNKETNEFVIRPIKEIRFVSNNIDPEPTKIIDIDGNEIDYDKETKDIFVFQVSDNFFEILDDLREKVKFRKQLEKEVS